MDTLLKQVPKQTYQKLISLNITFPVFISSKSTLLFANFQCFLIVIYAVIQSVRYKLRKIIQINLFT